MSRKTNIIDLIASETRKTNKMKVATTLLILASSVKAFSSPRFAVRSQALHMAEFDLDYGSRNNYEKAPLGDGGQGQFGAVSPSDWRVPGTSPFGTTSWPGADDGGDEPWFAEAVSTVSLDMNLADTAYHAFTKDMVVFKIAEFGKTNPEGFTSVDEALDKLVGSIGYAKVLESSPKVLVKAWAALQPKKEKKEDDKEEKKKPAPKAKKE